MLEEQESLERTDQDLQNMVDRLSKR
jgi:hypothetical protein